MVGLVAANLRDLSALFPRGGCRNENYFKQAVSEPPEPAQAAKDAEE